MLVKHIFIDKENPDFFLSGNILWLMSVNIHVCKDNSWFIFKDGVIMSLRELENKYFAHNFEHYQCS